MLNLLVTFLFVAGGRGAFFLSPVQFGSENIIPDVSHSEMQVRRAATASSTPLPTSVQSGDCISKSELPMQSCFQWPQASDSPPLSSNSSLTTSTACVSTVTANASTSTSLLALHPQCSTRIVTKLVTEVQITTALAQREEVSALSLRHSLHERRRLNTRENSSSSVVNVQGPG